MAEVQGYLEFTDKLLDVADKLGLIQAVKAKFVKQPDLAADKLIIVLEEISKIHELIEVELTKYLGLWFDPENIQSVKEKRVILLEFEGDKVKSRVETARGSCKLIQTIHNRYLNPWFQRVLTFDEEQPMMRSLFKSLDEYDGAMIDAIENLAKWLSSKAKITLDLVDDNKIDDANEFIKLARKEIISTRQRLSEAYKSNS